MNLFYLLLAVLGFGALITVHELGHFWAARLTGIPVKEFAVGFGPKLLSWPSKKYATQFFVRLIPLGGYCMFYGEDDVKGKESAHPDNMAGFAVWKRFVTTIMGPVMNALFAVVLLVGFFYFAGVPKGAPDVVTTVSRVEAGGAAEAAGVLAGDRLLTLDGVPVDETLIERVQLLGQKNQSGVLRVLRSGEELTLTITPKVDEAARQYRIGVSMDIVAHVERVPHQLSASVGAAFAEMARMAGAIVRAVGDLVFRGRGFQEMSGVVGITKVIVDQTKTAHAAGFVSVMAFISVNLGVMNLVPFPGLDGSRLIFLIWEGMFKKPFKYEAHAHVAGMVLLLGLIAFITLRDVVRLF